MECGGVTRPESRLVSNTMAAWQVAPTVLPAGALASRKAHLSGRLSESSAYRFLKPWVTYGGELMRRQQPCQRTVFSRDSMRSNFRSRIPMEGISPGVLHYSNTVSSHALRFTVAPLDHFK